MTKQLVKADSWQQELQYTIRTLQQLIEVLSKRFSLQQSSWWPLIESAISAESQFNQKFRFSVSRHYLSLANPQNHRCPILGQILPRIDELHDFVFANDDPLAEEANMPVPGLTHRYPDRALLYLSHHCAVYCRFCMRKRKVSKAGSAPGATDIEKAIQYIKQHSELTEVILSGGDPLSLSNEMLDDLLTELKQISHLSSVRIHSRMPVTLPSRIDSDFSSMLEKHSPLTLVTHFNHSVEISEPSKQAISNLRHAGVMVLNQSVLLKGINDSVTDLKDLFLSLIKVGVKPYYLHQCDEVNGVSHFRVSIEKGISLMRQLRGRIPGIALPTYVIDLPGGGGKVPVDSSYNESSDGKYRFKNYVGRLFELSDFNEGE